MERLALLYSDGSLNILTEGASPVHAWSEADVANEGEPDPEAVTVVVRVFVDVLAVVDRPPPLELAAIVGDKP